MLRSLIAALLITLACNAGAQAIDEAWIVERVVAGRYEELRKVEAASNAGSPVAMYWWASFMHGCVFGPCNEKGARALWMKAAEAGHGDSKAAVMLVAESRDDLDRLVQQFGPPSSSSEKAAYISALARVATPGPKDDSYQKARALTRELATSEQRLGQLFGVTAFEGLRNVEVLRAIVEAGYPRAAEQYRRGLRIINRMDYPQQLAAARNGDIGIAVALCQSVNVTEGFQRLPADLLAVCERALALGHAGVAPALLRHHMEDDGNPGAAAFFASLCAALLVACASDLADYHYKTSGKSPSWILWDAVAGLSGGFPPEEARLPPEVMRQVFTIRTRHALAERACVMRRYDAAKKQFEDDPACHYRRSPVTIPAEFLGAR